MTDGYVIEAYPSLEGEGIKLGSPTLFLRLAGCNLRCHYCDTRPAYGGGYPRYGGGYSRFGGGYSRFGGGEDPSLAGVKKGDWVFPQERRNPVNPVGMAVLQDWLSCYRSIYPTVVFTGGEPLLQAEFLATAAGLAKQMGFSTRLETNATLAGAWEKVAEQIDEVSADIKLPSSSGYELYDQHREFLGLVGEKLLHIKTVVNEQTGIDELLTAARIILEVNASAPLVIMPVSVNERPIILPQDKIFSWLRELGRLPIEVRIIPQMHKLWGLR
jgi:7-carboxy-7-deazaguanine synthase